jgi:hypothetical protein
MKHELRFFSQTHRAFEIFFSEYGKDRQLLPTTLSHILLGQGVELVDYWLQLGYKKSENKL